MIINGFGGQDFGSIGATRGIDVMRNSSGAMFFTGDGQTIFTPNSSTWGESTRSYLQPKTIHLAEYTVSSKSFTTTSYQSGDKSFYGYYIFINASFTVPEQYCYVPGMFCTKCYCDEHSGDIFTAPYGYSMNGSMVGRLYQYHSFPLNTLTTNASWNVYTNSYDSFRFYYSYTDAADSDYSYWYALTDTVLLPNFTYQIKIHCTNGSQNSAASAVKSYTLNVPLHFCLGFLPYARYSDLYS